MKKNAARTSDMQNYCGYRHLCLESSNMARMQINSGFQAEQRR